jgi:subtilase family serine protease
MRIAQIKLRPMLKLLLPALLIASHFSTVSYAATPDRIAGALTGGPTVTLQGNVHHKALPKYDQGPADPALRLGYVTLLTVPTAAQQKALTQLLAEQQDPRSPNYHKWLTTEQWADRFGLSHGDVQKLTDWLKSQGFTVQSVAHGRNWIVFSGTVSQMQSAFGIEFRRYNVDGEMHVANANSPRIPAALAGIVSGLRGLHDFYLKPMAARNTRAAHVARPDYYDPIFQSPAPQNFLAPGDIATMYDIDLLYNASPTKIDGTGQKLVIAGQTDIYLADINDFRAGFGLSPINGCTSDPTSGVVTACNAPNFRYQLLLPTGLSDPLAPSLGDLTEADLDIEWSGAVARNAQIIYVNAPLFFSGSTYLGGGVFEAWYYAVDNQSTLGETVISLSYGNCEFNDNFVLDSAGNPLSDEVELMKANTEGITFLNSTGDSGAAGCDGPTNSTTNPPNLAQGGLAVGYPASSPEVTAVGGTALTPAGLLSPYWTTTNRPDGGSAQNPPLPETSWNDDNELSEVHNSVYPTPADVQESYAIVATGGGPSNCAQQTADNSNCISGFGQPGWQTVTLSGQAGARFIPDVSLAASPNFPGYIFCTPQSAWISGSTNTASTCANGIPAALALKDSSNNPSPSLVGGTSASTPVMAGIVALLNQSLGALGNINPTLYALAKTSPTAFHPAATGDNKVACEAGQPPAPWPTALQCPGTVGTVGAIGYSATNKDATTSYNLVTGLGSVDANNLAIAFASPPAPPDFTLTPTVATFQVTQGSSINATVDVALASGFAGTITFTCTDSAPQSVCTAPPSITASGQVSFAITTTRATADLRRPFDRGTRIFYAALLPGLLGIVFMAGTRKRSARGLRLLGLIVVLGFSTLWLASCGGSSSHGTGSQGTPKGSYTITVTGTSGTTAIPTSFQITVQ